MQDLEKSRKTLQEVKDKVIVNPTKLTNGLAVRIPQDFTAWLELLNKDNEFNYKLELTLNANGFNVKRVKTEATK